MAPARVLNAGGRPMTAEHRITTLESGVRVVTEVVPAVRSVALGFWIGAGSVMEDDTEAGLSHLLEHMLFRGTARFASEEIDQIFDTMGAEVNAGTGKETTSVYTRVLDRHLQRAFDVMSDMVWRPEFGELEAEREVVLEEIAMYEDDPQDRVFDVLGEAVFGSHALGRAIIGHADVVGAASREQLRSFHASRYVPDNVVIAAAGSVDHDELVELARGAGPTSPQANGRATLEEVLAVEEAPLQERRVRFLRKDTEQYHVCLGGPGIARDDERRYALRVLDNVLGGTSSSRLFQEIRERRGLAYSVFSFSSLYAAAGQVGLYLGTRADNLSQALEVVAEELQRFVAEAVSEEEVVRSRENVKGRTVLSLESTSARMSRLGNSILNEMPILSMDEVIERVDAVSIEDVHALAAELFSPERLSVAGIGPDEEIFTSALTPMEAAVTAASGASGHAPSLGSGGS
jgi:predicted Zn-dependent peptidase